MDCGIVSCKKPFLEHWIILQSRQDRHSLLRHTIIGYCWPCLSCLGLFAFFTTSSCGLLVFKIDKTSGRMNSCMVTLSRTPWYEADRVRITFPCSTPLRSSTHDSRLAPQILVIRVVPHHPSCISSRIKAGQAMR